METPTHHPPRQWKSSSMKSPTPSKVRLKAPLSGQLVPLEQVRDPVFAQKMVGDGIAIDPVSQSLLAPCDGEVVMLHPAHHALTLATAEGIEILMHIGLDTINLKGKGFTPKVKNGDKVKAGAPLIDFDADFIATHAKSLVSMIVVTNPERVAAFERPSGGVTAGKDVILELTLAADGVIAPVEAGVRITSEAILIPNSAGLHARPAAVLANLAKKYTSDIWVQRGDSKANAKSVTGLMNLDVRRDDKVNLVAQGPDAKAAIQALLPLMVAGLGDDAASAPARASTVDALAKPAPVRRSDDPHRLLGVTASPGLAAGRVLQVRHPDVDFPEAAKDPAAEERALNQAIDQAKSQLEALQAQLRGQADANKAAIFAAHEEMLDDPELRDAVRAAILAGKSAGFAWQRTVNTQAERLSKVNTALLAARAVDLRDVGRRVLQNLTGTGPRRIDAPPDSILVAEELTPSDTASLDRSKVLGLCMTRGSATSHAAIIARSMGIPAVAGIDPRALEIPDGTPAILDGTRAVLQLEPSAEEMARMQVRQRRLALEREADVASAKEPAITTDGHPVEVVANIGGLADARSASSLGAEGVGLLRTELLFFERDAAPTEDEQTRIYSDVAAALGPKRPLVIRTLDVGGDKPLSYLPIAKEDNPFLGERGVRVGLNRPELLRTQLRAILRAASAGKVLVMFPMVATLTEWRAAKAVLEQERKSLGVAPIPVGIMVEIPAAAVMAEQFAREADFFSIGTNDLTQYTLAMDRNHPKLGPQVDALNPAVLKLIALTIEGARTHGRWVGVCGGMASDPQAVPILIGLGVDELSVSVPAIPAIKAQIRRLDRVACQKLAQTALSLGTAAEVRALVPDQPE
jgi:multiphosphoryl transfer protein